jgi:hypothetical protein
VPGVLGGVKKGEINPGRSSREEEEEEDRLRCEGMAEALWWWWLLTRRSSSDISREIGVGRGRGE